MWLISKFGQNLLKVIDIQVKIKIPRKKYWHLVKGVGVDPVLLTKQSFFSENMVMGVMWLPKDHENVVLGYLPSFLSLQILCTWSTISYYGKNVR
jgi:hypothetical protein